LDEKLLPSNPWAQRLPRDGSKHTLRFKADDHETEEREVVLERDSDVVVSLKPVRKSPEPAAVASAAPAKPKRPASAAPRKVSPACDPPFTVDDRGIKRYKPQCL
jgi:hypothetical protein